MSRQRASQSRSQQSRSQQSRSLRSRSSWSRYSWSEVCDLARALQAESRSRRALSEDAREDAREDAQTSSDRSGSMEVKSPSTSVGSPEAEPQVSRMNHTLEPRITRVERIRDQRTQQNLSAPSRPVSHLSDHARTDFDAARFKEAWRASRSLSEGSNADFNQDADKGSDQGSDQDSNHRLYGLHRSEMIPPHQNRETRRGQRSEADSYISSTSSSVDSAPSGWELLRDHFLAQRERRLEVEHMEIPAPEYTVRGASDPTAD